MRTKIAEVHTSKNHVLCLTKIFIFFLISFFPSFFPPAKCILQLWPYRRAVQRCDCPKCCRHIVKLSPEASLLSWWEADVFQTLKNIHEYNQLNMGGWRGLFLVYWTWHVTDFKIAIFAWLAIFIVHFSFLNLYLLTIM